MSIGPRLSLERAELAVQILRDRWGLDPATCPVVGSVRRRRPDVGDIEFLAPVERIADSLCARIVATMDPPNDGGLFAGTGGKGRIGYIVRGLKPYFLACSVMVRIRSADQPIPVQIFRYTPDNFGWQLVFKTGPAEFGEGFLVRWKKTHGIPMGDARYTACRDNHLIDFDGIMVPVQSEAEAFRLCNHAWIPPERRDDHVRVNEERKAARR